MGVLCIRKNSLGDQGALFVLLLKFFYTFIFIQDSVIGRILFIAYIDCFPDKLVAMSLRYDILQVLFGACDK